MNSTEFIQQLELLPADPAAPLPDYSMFESDSKTPSYLNFKGLQSFSDGIAESVQKDVLNSMLLAQRAASKAFPGEDQLDDWYDFYFKVLENVGWLISMKDFSKYSEKSDVFELEKAIISLVTDLLTAQQINVLLKSLELIKSLGKDDERLKVFQRNIQKHNRGNFQMGLAETQNGNVHILGTGFILKSKASMTNVLFLKFDKEEIELGFRFFRAELVASEYDKYRDLVKQKLGDPNEFIASLDV